MNTANAVMMNGVAALRVQVSKANAVKLIKKLIDFECEPDPT